MVGSSHGFFIIEPFQYEVGSGPLNNLASSRVASDTEEEWEIWNANYNTENIAKKTL